MSTPSSPLSALLEQIGVIVDHVPGGSVHRGFKEKQRETLSYSTASEIRACHLHHSNQDSPTDRERKRKEETDRQTAVEKERARGILKLRDEISEKSRDMIYRNIGGTN